MTRKIASLSLLIVVFLSGSFTSDDPVADLKLSWPIEIESEKGITTTLYQPQLESFQNNDLDNRTVLLEKMEIIKTHFPDILEDEKISNFSELLSEEIESWNLEMSLDRILASLDEVENLKELSDQINNDPPEIYFRNTPAILMMIDGDPILSKDEGSGLEYVVNTPFFIVKDKQNYYIHGGPFWYSSTEITDG